MTLTPENKAVLIKRLKTVAWYLGMQIAVAGLAYLAENAGLLGIPQLGQVAIGLLLSQVTKELNK